MKYPEIWKSTTYIPSGVTYAEGELLYTLSQTAHRSESGSVVEIGSYLGKSAIIMASTGPVVCIDHHRGNSEHQIGQPRCRPGTVVNGRVNTFPVFKQNLEKAGVWQNVIPVIADHVTAFSTLDTSLFPIAMLFVDAEHSYEITCSIIATWASRVKGLILFHDCNDDFPEVAQAISDSGLGKPVIQVDSIRGFEFKKK
jgi:predicted O-methyltransferase YrrM